MGQLDLFASVNGGYQLEPKIRLIQLFSGIGAQAKALKVLGLDFEDWHTCEWAYNSIVGYNAIHIKDKTDYSKDLTKQDLIDYLNGNISTDYNEPCDCSKKPESWLRNCYNNVKATHDLMNICNVKGKDLEINDLSYSYIISWSYPCQDLSLAGLQKGQEEGSNTRSSLCFEVLRLVSELTPEQREKTCLIMENVPQAIGSKNLKDFQIVEKKLADLGYINHIKVLNLKDYGLPQNRERVFMISCFGYYQFPDKLKLKYRLKDFLQKKVDEKYYLSEETINRISNWKSYENPLESVMGKESITPTITTRIAESCDGGINASMKVVSEDLEKTTNLKPSFEEAYNQEIKSGLAGTIKTTVSSSNMTFVAEKYKEYGSIPEMFNPYNKQAYLGTYQYAKSDNFMGDKDRFQKGKDIADCLQTSQKEGVVFMTERGGLMIKENNNKGYKIAQVGDGVNLASRMEKQRGNVQKGLAQTLKTQIEVGVVVEDEK